MRGSTRRWALVTILAAGARAAAGAEAKPAEPPKAEEEAPKAAAKSTRHAVRIDGASVDYTATVGWLIANRGPRYSVDFTGGTLIQVRLGQEHPADQLRDALSDAGFRGVELQQLTGEHRNEFIIRMKKEAAAGDTLMEVDALAAAPAPPPRTPAGRRRRRSVTSVTVHGSSTR